LDLITIKGILVYSRKANVITNTRRTNPKDKVWGKARNFIRPSSVINVVVLITFHRIAEFPNTLLICTKKSLKEANKAK
jgi:hypothetical protein